MGDILNNATQFTEIIMKNFVREGHICVDATTGNGKDTLILAKLVGVTGFVYSFDIQKIALENAGDLLAKKGLHHRVSLVHDSHENIRGNIEGEIDFIIYNLGYLPGGDKSVRTSATTTIRSINNALYSMVPGAIMLITAYTGHEGGLYEYQAVRGLAEELDQNGYNVFEFSFINQKNNPPITIGIEVRGGRIWQR
ncbi:MAG: tRNA (mnm(5)s(2)U34)-methyltransferase [Bacillota bacterium]